MPGAYLEITLKIADHYRAAAAKVYQEFREPFLATIPGAYSKELLIRSDDVQVLHGFDTAAHAAAYLETDFFRQNVQATLVPLLSAEPEIRIYTRA